MRVQVNLSDEIVKKIDEYCKMVGVSRSAMCATWIGQAVVGTYKSMETLEAMGVSVSEYLLKDKSDDES